MKPRRTPALLAAALLSALLPPSVAAASSVQLGDAYAYVDDTAVVIGTAGVERRWADDYWTQTDKRTGATWLGVAELEITLVSTERIPVSSIEPKDVTLRTTSSGVEVSLFFDPAPGVRVQRIARAIPGVAAIRMQTIIHADAPLALRAYTLERVVSPVKRFATATAFNGGSDWHSESGYDYRRDQRGLTFDAPGQWLQTDDGALGLLLQRRNYHSSRMRWGYPSGAVVVDLSKDVAYLGPLEEDRVNNGVPYPGGPARFRLAEAGRAFPLEPVIIAMGTSREDLQWQAYKMLRTDMAAYPRTINFNTDRVHGGPEIGVRDGVNLSVFNRLLPTARDLGVETFVLDDGWQLYNGDWRTADRARYPDGDLTPVRDALKANGMNLGLWMAPGAFHPSSELFKEHPAWACAPTGLGSAAVNVLGDPKSGSNAAGIGVWNMRGIDEAGSFADRLRDDIDNLVERLDVRQFKFDFLVWLDCLNALPADMYQYHDTFFEILDSLRAEHPQVGFGLDETNDFRGFPYESILYGPTWFQNGNPPADAVLHNAWTLAPQVPGYAVGQAVTIRPGDSMDVIDEKMAAALTYAMTFWTDLRELEGTPAVVARARLWTDFAKQHRGLNDFSYPLLADPLGRGTWTGMQPWNPDTQSGYALLYRMGAPNATESVPFKALDDAATYRVTDITPTGALIAAAEYSGATLEAGIPLTIAAANGVRVLRVERI